ncbi:MAG: hypothetical protein ABI234_01000 [Ktedonobacteraceae bacterium]
MGEFNKEQALARYIELEAMRNAEFMRLPNVERRIARGDYDFRANVDGELGELQQEAQQNGFYLESVWDEEKRNLVHTIEQMSPKEYAAYLAEEQEILLGDLKWRYEQGLIEP